ncbi:proline dehydrogenase [Coemansia sp. RSA 1939]|nr:proline dehydrogenase [Coemansia sp. RSA 1939]KAJ2608409.1 proline dehydrogenase [Coemansia sp. RSA 1804]KAJ2693081.1 proline dehydrogenase [Coemansia sp. RSA 1285]
MHPSSLPSAIAAIPRPTATIAARLSYSKRPLVAAYALSSAASRGRGIPSRAASTAALLARATGSPATRAAGPVSSADRALKAAPVVVALAGRRGVSSSGHYHPRPSVLAAAREDIPGAEASVAAAKATALPPSASPGAAALPPDEEAPLLRPDPTLALGEQSMLKLMSLWLVYRACGNTALIRMAPSILELFKKLHLSWISNAVIRRTFFAWFCAGEMEREIVHTMRRLQESGIGSILDYSAEADIGEDCAAVPASTAARAQANVKADALAKEYFHGMHMASQVPQAFAALKITGLADPEVLYRLSMPYRPLRAAFEAADQDGDGCVDYAQFKDSVLAAMPGGGRVASPSGVFSMVDANNDGLIDWVDIQMALGIDNPLARPLYLRSGVGSDYGALESDVEDYERMISRTRAVIQQAAARGVRVMVDAEHSYFQPMIDHVALAMQREFNTPKPALAVDAGAAPAPATLVFNTYQMYRADAFQRMADDYERAQREGWRFASKLVRGAYMELERERAARLAYPSPINPTLEASHESYNRGVRFLMRRIATAQKNGDSMVPALFVATHNNESIERAMRLVRDLGIELSGEPVMFGQLLGMQDATSYALAKLSLPIYKYVPYGGLDEVLPYLIRRAQENSAVADAITKESSFVLREIMRRIVGAGGSGGRKDQSTVESTSSV